MNNGGVAVITDLTGIEAFTSLTELLCANNQLTSLNVTNNTNLKVLLCSRNQIKTLDLTQNAALTDFHSRFNQLCQLNINNGNNAIITSLSFADNPKLNCVVVDNPNGDHSVWRPTSFTNYVGSNEACSDLIPVDLLNDFIGKSYTLPVISNGNYFTQPNGKGQLLHSGDLIETSQVIYIFNEINCYSNESNFNVIISNEAFLIPKFFTPNNDGTNDTWRVIDNSNSISTIFIYNRYGKLLKSLLPNSIGWDGTFNGKQMNTYSYWYQILLTSNEVLRGYFALKR